MRCFSSVAKSGSCRHQQRYRRRLLVEPLEDRCVPTTITPTTFADGVLGSGSLRDAVLQFNADTGSGDDTIELQAGTYTLTIQNAGGHHETAGLTGDLNLTQSSHRWNIQGAGSSGTNATIIDASQLQDRVFEIVTSGTQVVFRDLVIQGGLAQDNGSNGALAGSTDALGGGILNNGGAVTLDHVVLQNNVARAGFRPYDPYDGYNALGGGAYSTSGTLTIIGAVITNNQAIGGNAVGGGHGGSGGGGGLYSTNGTLTITGATIANSQATGGRGWDGLSVAGGDGGSGLGGGLYATAGSLDIADTSIANNQATGGPAGTGSLSGDVGQGGTGQGGGLYVNGSPLTISTTSIASNQATGGLNVIRGGHLGRSPGEGAGLFNSGTLTVSNSTLSGNSASSSLHDDGAGIYNSGTLTVSNSNLSGNSASYNGGGIYNGSLGMVTVMGSTLSGNSANSYGNGISNDGTLAVSNSTLTGNYSGNGGGIFTSGTHSVTLTNVTLTANRARVHGGGLYVASGSPMLHNTLIAGNYFNGASETPDDVYGALNSGGNYTLIGDGTGMTGFTHGVNGNLVGSASSPIDPLLGPLQENGGPTKTHALLAGSPALNAGDPVQLGVADQRGVVRAGGVNIGAYQASASAFVVTVSGTVASGTPFDVSVQAVDVFGQVAFGYRGTVTFSVTDPDPAVVLPTDYTFTDDDQGTHPFTSGFTLITPGPWTLTVADLANGLSIDVTLTVNP
jgi:hypothetical protein